MTKRNLKKEIRKEILRLLNKQGREKALLKSRLIKEKLFSLREFKKAKLVMFYASKTREVNTEEMIDEALRLGKKVVLPRCSGRKEIIPKRITERGKDLEKGTYGLYEPKKNRKSVRPEDIDLIIVPGVAFDRKKKRLGRGKGYYDRFLQRLSPGKIKIGLAFDFQIVKNLPQDPHDVPVSKIITN